MRLLLSFINEYRRPYSLLLAVLVVSAVLESLAVAVLYPLLVAVLGSTDAPAGPVLGGLVRVADGLVGDRLLGALALFMVVVPLNSVAKLLREWLQARTSATTTYDVKRRIFDRLRTRPYGYFLAHKEGDITYRLTVAPQNLAAALLFAAVTVSYSLTSLATFVLLLTIEWRVTIAMLLIGAVFFGVNRYVARRFSYNAGREKLAAQSAELGVIHEFVVGAKDVLAADASGAWMGRFLEQSSTYRRFFVRDLTWSAVPGLFLELGVMLLAGAAAVILRTVAPDAILALLPVLAVYVYAARQMLGTVAVVSRQLLRIAALESDSSVLRSALVEQDGTVEKGGAPRDRVPPWERIRFDSVSFRYPGRSATVVTELSFAIERDRTTALVGGSGVGKSTLLYLLLRLFAPTTGRVIVGDADLADLDPKAWRARVGYVGQELFVFNGTVAENIAFGEDRPRASIEAAARAAQADEFIRALPGGYATVIGDRGMTLSAGQRQRLVIARALVREPELLLLDEATSALDNISEELVQRSLAEIAGRCTVVVVAHRLSTVRRADRIVVLEGGRAVEQGRHDDLVGAGGAYARLLGSFEAPTPSPI